MPRQLVRRLAPILLGLIIGTASLVCGAQEPSPSEAVSASTPPAQNPVELIKLYIAAPLATEQRLVEITRYLLKELGAEVQFQRIESVSRASVLRVPLTARKAAVWLDATDPKSTLVVVGDSLGQRFLVRKVSHPGGFSEVTIETVGQIVATGVEVILSGEQLRLDRREAEKRLSVEESTGKSDENVAQAPPAPQVRPEKDESESGHESWVFRAVAAGEVLRVAQKLPPALGLKIGARMTFVRERYAFALEALIVGRPPVSWASEAVGARLFMMSAGIAGSATWRMTRTLGVVGGAGPHLELIHVAPQRAASSTLVLTEPALLAYTAFRFEGGFEFQITDWLSVRAVAVFDALPAPVDFTLAQDEGSQTVLSLGRLRWGGALGAAW